MNFKQKLVVIVMDIALLAQLTYSIYLAKQHPEEMVFVFFKAFFPMVIVTLIAARILIKRFGPAVEATAGSRDESRIP